MHLTALPSSVLSEIVSFLDVSCRCHVRTACRALHAIEASCRVSERLCPWDDGGLGLSRPHIFSRRFRTTYSGRVDTLSVEFPASALLHSTMPSADLLDLLVTRLCEFSVPCRELILCFSLIISHFGLAPTPPLQDAASDFHQMQLQQQQLQSHRQGQQHVKRVVDAKGSSAVPADHASRGHRTSAHTAVSKSSTSMGQQSAHPAASTPTDAKMAAFFEDAPHQVLHLSSLAERRLCGFIASESVRLEVELAPIGLRSSSLMDLHNRFVSVLAQRSIAPLSRIDISIVLGRTWAAPYDLVCNMVQDATALRARTTLLSLYRKKHGAAAVAHVPDIRYTLLFNVLTAANLFRLPSSDPIHMDTLAEKPGILAILPDVDVKLNLLPASIVPRRPPTLRVTWLDPKSNEANEGFVHSKLQPRLAKTKSPPLKDAFQLETLLRRSFSLLGDAGADGTVEIEVSEPLLKDPKVEVMGVAIKLLQKDYAHIKNIVLCYRFQNPDMDLLYSTIQKTCSSWAAYLPGRFRVLFSFENIFTYELEPLEALFAMFSALSVIKSVGVCLSRSALFDEDSVAYHAVSVSPARRHHVYCSTFFVDTPPIEFTRFADTVKAPKWHVLEKLFKEVQPSSTYGRLFFRFQMKTPKNFAGRRIPFESIVRKMAVLVSAFLAACPHRWHLVVCEGVLTDSEQTVYNFAFQPSRARTVPPRDLLVYAMSLGRRGLLRDMGTGGTEYEYDIHSWEYNSRRVFEEGVTEFSEEVFDDHVEPAIRKLLSMPEPRVKLRLANVTGIEVELFKDLLLALDDEEMNKVMKVARDALGECFTVDFNYRDRQVAFVNWVVQKPMTREGRQCTVSLLRFLVRNEKDLVRGVLDMAAVRNVLSLVEQEMKDRNESIASDLLMLEEEDFVDVQAAGSSISISTSTTTAATASTSEATAAAAAGVVDSCDSAAASMDVAAGSSMRRTSHGSNGVHPSSSGSSRGGGSGVCPCCHRVTGASAAHGAGSDSGAGVGNVPASSALLSAAIHRRPSSLMFDDDSPSADDGDMFDDLGPEDDGMDGDDDVEGDNDDDEDEEFDVDFGVLNPSL